MDPEEVEKAVQRMDEHQQASDLYWRWSLACWALARLDHEVAVVQMRGSQRNTQDKRGTVKVLGFTYSTPRGSDLCSLVMRLADSYVAEWCGHWQLRLWGPNKQSVVPAKARTDVVGHAAACLGAERHLRGKTRRNELWLERPSTAHGMPERKAGW